MKRFIWLLLSFTIFAITSCGDNATNFCENGELDSEAGETEIDCGGDCEPCPPTATLTANYYSLPLTAFSINGDQVGSSGIEISAAATAGTYINFTFVGTALNTSLPMISASFRDENYDDYDMQLDNPGEVVLTTIDEKRKIISGTFNYDAVNYNIGSQIKINDGVFSNVRYN